MQKEQIPMAQEGYPFILFGAFATLILALLNLLIPAGLCLLLTGFMTWFFRDPVRITPQEKHAIISPADGKVILIKEVDDQRYLQQRVRKVSIFMNVFNVHVNRIPFAGQVEKIRLEPGRFYAADKEAAELHNEACALLLTTPQKQRCCVVQVAGLIARRIVCRAEEGDILEPGERYGIIRFGSRVDLYLPLDATLSVEKGQKVVAGESILGYFSYEQAA